MRKIMLALAVGLGGCSLAGKMPAVGGLWPTQDAAWRTETAGAVVPDADWWDGFHDGALVGLLDAAMAHNTDMTAALARVKQARAAVGVAQAALWPSVDVSAGTDRGFGGSAATRAARGGGWQNNAAATLSYQADLFGGNASTAQAARSTAAQQRFLADALAVSLRAQVAETYLSLRGANTQVALAVAQETAAREALALSQRRLDAGVDSAADVAVRQSVLAQAQQALATARTQQATLADTLAALVGADATRFVAPQATLAGLEMPALPVLPPVEVLAHRPDVAAAEAALRAAHADIGAARAAYFPKLKFSLADAVTFNPAVWTTSVGAQVAANIFNAGGTRAAVRQATAKQEELLETYKGTILTALKEANSALSTWAEAGRGLDAAQMAAQAAAVQRKAAEAQLAVGTIDRLTYLTAVENDQTAQNALAGAWVARGKALIGVYQAMGGGWK